MHSYTGHKKSFHQKSCLVFAKTVLLKCWYSKVMIWIKVLKVIETPTTIMQYNSTAQRPAAVGKKGKFSCSYVTFKPVWRLSAGLFWADFFYLHFFCQWDLPLSLHLKRKEKKKTNNFSVFPLHMPAHRKLTSNNMRTHTRTHTHTHTHTPIPA